MWTALGAILPLATALAVSPLPVVTGIVLLLSPQGRRKSAAFALGWFVAIGVLASLAWRKRPERGADVPRNKLFERLDTMSFLGSLTFGLAQGFVVLKNLPLAFSAGAVLGEAEVTLGEAAVALAIFALVASGGMVVPLVVAITVVVVLAAFFLGQGLVS